MRRIGVILVTIICFASLLIGCSKNPNEVFKEFSNDKELALQNYNKLSNDNKK